MEKTPKRMISFRRLDILFYSPFTVMFSLFVVTTVFLKSAPTVFVATWLFRGIFFVLSFHIFISYSLNFLCLIRTALFFSFPDCYFFSILYSFLGIFVKFPNASFV